LEALGAELMRRWLTAALLMLAATSWAHGADAICDPRPGGGPFSVQWIEGGEMWGARVAAADVKWNLQVSWHSNIVICETCDADQIRFAHFWLPVANPADRDIDREVSPEFFAYLMMVLHMDMPLVEYRADGDSQPVTIAGLDGKARKIGIRFPDGRSYEAIIVSVSRGCVGLQAVASATNSRHVPLDRIGAFASAIDIQWYGPRRDPCPPGDIPLLEWLQSHTECPSPLSTLPRGAQ
jgi:hypothetical protein